MSDPEPGSRRARARVRRSPACRHSIDGPASGGSARRRASAARPDFGLAPPGRTGGQPNHPGGRGMSTSRTPACCGLQVAALAVMLIGGAVPLRAVHGAHPVDRDDRQGQERQEVHRHLHDRALHAAVKKQFAGRHTLLLVLLHPDRARAPRRRCLQQIPRTPVFNCTPKPIDLNRRAPRAFCIDSGAIEGVRVLASCSEKSCCAGCLLLGFSTRRPRRRQRRRSTRRS